MIIRSLYTSIADFDRAEKSAYRNKEIAWVNCSTLAVKKFEKVYLCIDCYYFD